MKKLEIIQARVNIEDAETVTQELRRQIRQYNQTGAELKVALYCRDRIENDYVSVSATTVIVSWTRPATWAFCWPDF